MSTDRLTDDDLARLAALYLPAAPLPWVPDIDDPHEAGGGYWTGKWHVGDRDNPGPRGWSWCMYEDGHPHSMPGVRLVEGMVNAGPSLLAEVVRLRAEVASLKESLDEQIQYASISEGRHSTIGSDGKPR